MNTKFTGFKSGVGGIRTLVQTSNSNAFYTLSFCLSFRELAGQKLPTHPLFLIKFQNSIKTLLFLCLLLRYSKTKRRKPRLLKSILLVYLVDRGAILL